MTSRQNDRRPFTARIATPLARESLDDRQRRDGDGRAATTGGVPADLSPSRRTRHTDVQQETTDDD